MVLRVWFETLDKCIKYKLFFSVRTITLFRPLIRYLSVGSCQRVQLVK